MRKIFMALTAGVIAVPAGVVACSGVGVATASASVYAMKGGAFCGADDTIDRDTANVELAAGFVKALKAHKHQIDVMKANLPSGSVGQDAKKLLTIAESVIAGGNPNKFFAAAGNSSGAIDTYCGVQGNGQASACLFQAGYEDLVLQDVLAGLPSGLERDRPMLRRCPLSRRIRRKSTNSHLSCRRCPRRSRPRRQD